MLCWSEECKPRNLQTKNYIERIISLAAQRSTSNNNTVTNYRRRNNHNNNRNEIRKYYLLEIITLPYSTADMTDALSTDKKYLSKSHDRMLPIIVTIRSKMLEFVSCMIYRTQKHDTALPWSVASVAQLQRIAVASKRTNVFFKSLPSFRSWVFSFQLYQAVSFFGLDKRTKVLLVTGATWPWCDTKRFKNSANT